MRNFLWNKKAAKCRSKLLAYQKFACIEAMQNGEVGFEQIPMEEQKEKTIHFFIKAKRHSLHYILYK